MTPIDKSGRCYFFNKQGERVASLINFYKCENLVNLATYPHSIVGEGRMFVKGRESVNTIIDDILRGSPVDGHMFEYTI